MNRFCDLTLAAFALVLISPLLALIGAAVALDSPGGAVYRHRRIGRRFQPFELLKFRTMVRDANQLGPSLTARDDRRVTRVGRFLRRTKLDELLQLINVLRGDMSIVGPRPETPTYVAMFREDYEQLLTVRPGITGMASVKYCDESALLGDGGDSERVYVNKILPAKIALEKLYLQRRSTWFDLQILMYTVLGVVFGVGRERLDEARRYCDA